MQYALTITSQGTRAYTNIDSMAQQEYFWMLAYYGIPVFLINGNAPAKDYMQAFAKWVAHSETKIRYSA